MNEKFNKLITYEASSYDKLEATKLVVFVIDTIEKLDIHLSLESIAVAAIKLFPEKFCLEGHPEQLHSGRVYNALNKSRDANKLVVGKMSTGYQITEMGKETITILQDTLKVAFSLPKAGPPINLKAYEEDAYISHNNRGLILYAMSVLKDINMQPTLDNITLSSFTMFPEKFCLVGYPEYADSNKVADTLSKLVMQKKIKHEKTNPFYFLSPVGEVLAERVKDELSQPITPSTIKSPYKSITIKESHIKRIAQTKAYQKYLSNNFNDITTDEICIVLLGTTETPPDVFKENLKSLKFIAEEIKDSKALDFLNKVEHKFRDFLMSGNTGSGLEEFKKKLINVV